MGGVATALPVRAGTPAARWVIVATVLGSGIAFLDSTVVNVALPSIGDDLGAGLTGLQWVLDGYLVSLTALILLGGALGDRYGRKQVFLIGLVAFTAASVLCGLAPSTGALIGARVLQGAGAALLVPGSLAILSASFHPDDRARAVGMWSGLAGVSTAIAPFAGGWLIDAASWRWIFLLNVPLAAVAGVVTVRHVPESRDEAATAPPDLAGAALASVGLATLAYSLIGMTDGVSPLEAVAGLVGVAALVSFVVVEGRRAEPMLPLELFRSRQFSGANAVTLAVYAGLGGAFFLLVLQLQLTLGYSALEAGMALLPVTVIILLLSTAAGSLAQRIGPRLPMTVGPAVVACGLLILSEVHEGSRYTTSVLPGAVVFGFGLALTVAPLTAAVLGAVEERHVGVGSAVNNAVARLAGLLAVAVLPGVAGIDAAAGSSDFTDGFRMALRISAVICLAGAAIAALTIRRGAAVSSTPMADVSHPCQHPCVAGAEAEEPLSA